MKPFCPFRTFLLVAAVAVATGTASPQEVRRALVVRHDAAVLRLHEDLLNTLLTPDLLTSVQVAVWGEEFAAVPVMEAWISSLTVVQGAADWFQQPGGVFAGILQVRFQDGPEDKREEILKGLAAGLEAALRKHLDEGPREWLARQRDALFREVVDGQEQLARLRGELAALPPAGPEELERQWSASLQESATLELDIRTEEAALQLLQERMAAAQAQLERLEADGQRREEVLAALQAQLQRVEGALDGGGREVAELAAALRHIGAQLTAQAVEREAGVRARDEQAGRVRDLAAQIEHASLVLHRAQSRRAAIDRLIDERRAALGERLATAARRRDLEFRVRMLEQEVEGLRQRAGGLTERMGGLREVRVELWR